MVATKIVVLLWTNVNATAPPMLTVAPGRNPLPVIVTGVPPTVAPASGRTAAIAGGGTNRYV